MPFNQMMDFPVELTLRTTEEGIRMFAVPVREVAKLHEKSHTWRDQTLREGENPLADVAGELFHIRGDFALGEAEQLGFVVRGTPVTYDVAKQELSCRDRTAPLKLLDGHMHLELLVDRTSLEIYGNEGAIYMPIAVLHPDDDRSLEVFATGGDATAVSLEVHELRSIWQAPGRGE